MLRMERHGSATRNDLIDERSRELPPARRSASTRWWCLLALTVLTGCYKYVPVSGVVPTGAEVRVRLNEQGGAALAKRLGVAPSALEGQVLAPASDSLVLRVTSTTSALTAQRIRWVGERVAIPADAVAYTERRTLDKRRTVAVAASAVVGSVVVFLIVRNTRGVAGGDGTPGGGGGIPP